MFKNLIFIFEGLKQFRTIGTFTRTSKSTSRGILKLIDLSNVEFIIELGAGDGAITKILLDHMKCSSRLIVFETNPLFCSILKKIEDERLEVINDSAENLDKHLKMKSINEVDAIISTLPFILIPALVRARIVSQCIKSLKSSGFFFQLHYSLSIKKFYQRYFHQVKVKLFVGNIPPAYLLVCKKKQV